MLWIVNDPDLSVKVQRFAVRAANVLGQLPESAPLLQMVAREVQRRQHLVDASLVRLQAQDDHLAGMLLQEASDGAYAKANGPSRLMWSTERITLNTV